MQTQVISDEGGFLSILLKHVLSINDFCFLSNISIRRQPLIQNNSDVG